MAEPLPFPEVFALLVERASHEPNACDVHGGSIVEIIGTGFVPPVEIRIRVGGEIVLDLEGKVAAGYVWDPDHAVTRTRIYAGMPALPAGMYLVSVHTDGGTSDPIEVEYRLFAEEHRVLSVRQKFAKAWRTGQRFLRR